MPDAKTILASRDQLGCVYECACGTIHVALGPVELKFTREFSPIAPLQFQGILLAMCSFSWRTDPTRIAGERARQNSTLENEHSFLNSEVLREYVLPESSGAGFLIQSGLE
jgi:hypothetical protein